MSAGTAYSKRYGAGFADLPTQTTPVDQQFLNAVETALLQLLGAAPTVDGQVAQWDNVNTRYGPALLLNKNIDPAAAIAKSKLDFTGANGIVDADISGVAAIARSKLNFGSGLVNADIAAGASIATSKVSGGVGMQLLWDSVDAAVALPAASITTPALSGAYKHLLIELVTRTDAAGVDADMMTQFNGDALGHYDYEVGGTKAAATLIGSTAAATSMLVCSGPGTNGSAGEVGSGYIRIQNYASVAQHKIYSGLFGKFVGTTTADFVAALVSGRWRSSAALSTLTFFPVPASNFVAPSRITVYGEL